MRSLDSLPIWISGLVVGLCLFACEGSGSTPYPGNLLHGRRPIAARGIVHPERLTDGAVPVDGDPWFTDLSAVFSRGASYAVFDLGAAYPIASGLVVGDNNDVFSIALSEDGKDYREIWRAPAVRGAGMRPRTVDGLTGHARFVRVMARGGDNFVSAGELMLFAQKPTPWPPQPRHRAGLPPLVEAQRWLVALGVAFGLLLLCADRRVPPWAFASAALGAAGVLFACVQTWIELWPPTIELGELTRAVIAAVAVVAVALWTWRGAQLRLCAVKSVLGVLAVLGVTAFYNFGAPWFWDAGAKRLTPVHTYDMRVYFPVAKYFDELRFDGIYLASVEAYLEGKRLGDRALERVDMRDLRTNEIAHARDLVGEIHAVKQRFSPERWSAFVRDMRFFWVSMGEGDYLGSLSDHGGNATPVWLALAHLLFAPMVASERALTVTALLDPLLLLLTFVCIARSFGLRAMLVCLIVFGASDFPMFGSDWAGSTLRFDWMATLGLGVCALRTRRYVLGGALLAHAGLVRAFPASAIAFTPVPVVLFALERLWRRRGLVPAEIAAAQPGLVKVLASAAATSALLVGLSIALFGLGPAWVGWFEKISLHTEQPNTNHLGVRTLAAFDPDLSSDELARSGVSDPWAEWQKTQLTTYESRAMLALAIRVLLLGLCVLACRHARTEQAALLGLILIPVFTYPANYYLHYVFLLPLLAVDQRRWLALWIEGVLLLMCLLEYFTLSLVIDVRFFFEAVILLSGLAAILLPLAWSALRDARAEAAAA
jgi:hypothetical protein